MKTTVIYTSKWTYDNDIDINRFHDGKEMVRGEDEDGDDRVRQVVRLLSINLSHRGVLPPLPTVRLY